jgi:hypothetical protein
MMGAFFCFGVQVNFAEVVVEVVVAGVLLDVDVWSYHWTVGIVSKFMSYQRNGRSSCICFR